MGNKLALEAACLSGESSSSKAVTSPDALADAVASAAHVIGCADGIGTKFPQSIYLPGTMPTSSTRFRIARAAAGSPWTFITDMRILPLGGK
jgi:hypothetical protein